MFEHTRKCFLIWEGLGNMLFKPPCKCFLFCELTFTLHIFFYLVSKCVFHILQVVENGNPTERKNWFPDIEPFFNLLGYENVPPYLKVSGMLEILLLTL